MKMTVLIENTTADGSRLAAEHGVLSAHLYWSRKIVTRKANSLICLSRFCSLVETR